MRGCGLNSKQTQTVTSNKDSWGMGFHKAATKVTRDRAMGRPEACMVHMAVAQTMAQQGAAMAPLELAMAQLELAMAQLDQVMGPRVAAMARLRPA